MKKLINKISKGIIKSVTPSAMPEGAVADSFNGKILSYKNGVFSWKANTGQKTIPADELVDGIVDTYFFVEVSDGVIMAGLTGENKTVILKLQINEDQNELQSTILYQGYELKINKAITVLSYYESEEVEYVYWLEEGQPQKSINIKNSISEQIAFVNFASTYEYSNIIFKSYIPGSLVSGNYFYAYRSLSTKGKHKTPWSIVNGPVTPRNKVVPESWNIHSLKPEDYHTLKNDEVTETGHRLYIEKIDGKYDRLEVVSLYQSSDNEISEAEVFYSGEVLLDVNGGMIIDHTSRGSGYIISVDSVLEPGITILSAKDFTLVDRLNVLTGYEKNKELDDTAIIKKEKWNGVTLSVGQKEMSLAGNFQDKNEYQFTDEYFQPLPGKLSSNGEPQKFVFSYSMYKKNNNAVVTKAYDIINDWNNYKGGLYSSMLRYFKEKETYRVGILPVDIYGNKLGVRWLGDILIPNNDQIEFREWNGTAWQKNPETHTGKYAYFPFFYNGMSEEEEQCIESDFYNEIQEGSLNIPPWLTPSWYNRANTINPNTGVVPFQLVGKINHLIVNNLDITDLVELDKSGNPLSCKIQGFHIVVSNRDKLYEDEFIGCPVVKESQNLYIQGDRDFHFDFGIPGFTLYDEECVNNAIICYNPDMSLDGASYEGKTIEYLNTYGSIIKRDDYYAPFLLDEMFTYRHKAFSYYYNVEFTTEERAYYYEQFAFYNYLALEADKIPVSEGLKRYKIMPGASLWGIYGKKKNYSPFQARINEGLFIDRIDHSVPFQEQGIYLSSNGIKINNGSNSVMVNNDDVINAYEFGSGCKGYILSLDKSIKNSLSYWPRSLESISPYEDTKRKYVNAELNIFAIKNNKTVFYEGNSPESLAKTEYRSTWHYQPITKEVLMDIKTSTGRFIFNNIHVFGGDTILGMYSFQKQIRTEIQNKPDSWLNGAYIHPTWTDDTPSAAYPDVDTHPDHEDFDKSKIFAESGIYGTCAFHNTFAVIIPMQSSRNIAMGLNDGWLKNQSKQYYKKKSINDSEVIAQNQGIGSLSELAFSEVPYIKYENQNWDEFSIKTDMLSLSYYGIPALFEYTNKFLNHFIWSEYKYTNEPYDSFRSFPLLNKLEVDGVHGVVNAIAGIDQRLFYWQDKAIGYIPIKEKSYVKDESGSSIGVSTSESFKEFFTPIKGIGCSNRKEFCILRDGFSWYDHKNETWFYMDEKFQIIDILKDTNNYKIKEEFLRPLKLNKNELTKYIKIFESPDEDTIYLSAANVEKTSVINGVLQSSGEWVEQKHELGVVENIISSSGNQTTQIYSGIVYAAAVKTIEVYPILNGSLANMNDVFGDAAKVYNESIYNLSFTPDPGDILYLKKVDGTTIRMGEFVSFTIFGNAPYQVAYLNYTILSEEDRNILAEYEVQTGDVVITYVRAVGEIDMEDNDFTLGNSYYDILFKAGKLIDENIGRIYVIDDTDNKFYELGMPIAVVSTEEYDRVVSINNNAVIEEEIDPSGKGDTYFHQKTAYVKLAYKSKDKLLLKPSGITSLLSQMLPGDTIQGYGVFTQPNPTSVLEYNPSGAMIGFSSSIDLLAVRLIVVNEHTVYLNSSFPSFNYAQFDVWARNSYGIEWLIGKASSINTTLKQLKFSKEAIPMLQLNINNVLLWKSMVFVEDEIALPSGQTASVTLAVTEPRATIKTIGFNYKLKQLTYTGDDLIFDGFNFKDNFFASPYIEQEKESYIRFTVNSDYEIYKVFDCISVFLKAGMVNKIRFHNNDFDIIETIDNNEYFEMRKKQLIGSIPEKKETDERIRGYYLNIDLIVSKGGNAEIESIITEVREDWS